MEPQHTNKSSRSTSNARVLDGLNQIERQTRAVALFRERAMRQKRKGAAAERNSDLCCGTA
eukprot:1137646-Pelagomonas_calceolata.AAC.2